MLFLAGEHLPDLRYRGPEERVRCLGPFLDILHQLERERDAENPGHQVIEPDCDTVRRDIPPGIPLPDPIMVHLFGCDLFQHAAVLRIAGDRREFPVDMVFCDLASLGGEKGLCDAGVLRFSLASVSFTLSLRQLPAWSLCSQVFYGAGRTTMRAHYHYCLELLPFKTKRSVQGSSLAGGSSHTGFRLIALTVPVIRRGSPSAVRSITLPRTVTQIQVPSFR